jgi:SAM-dependent methyltransferase
MIVGQHESSAKVEQNRLLHNKIADRYHRIHDDIFNPYEQDRIRNHLSTIRGTFVTEPPLALDYGCGSGNLTHHLRRLGFRVVSADISDRFIELLAQRYSTDQLVTPYLLAGDLNKDLKQYTFDLVCVYSVLHHLPDYLHVLKSLITLIGQNGYLYIDHEACDSFWMDDEKYLQLQRRSRWRKLLTKWPSLFSWNWYAMKYRMVKEPRFQPEGDLHVWKDDHIEWARIRCLAAEQRLREIHSEDYLSYRPYYSAELFHKYSAVTADMHCSVFKKGQ